jgi:hypothetical protein
MWRAVLALLTAIAVAGCGATDSNNGPWISNPKVNPIVREYVVCTAPTNGCTGDAEMKARPASMTLSGDGSLYVKDISWTGWGTATATGHGTAEADDCDPNCAQGTYSPHPASLVLTSPRPWRGGLAYGRITEYVAQIGWHQTFTRNLMPGAAPSWSRPPARQTRPPGGAPSNGRPGSAT